MEIEACHHFEGFGRRVQVSNEVWRIWNQYQQVQTGDPEACGVLIGWTSLDRKTLHIDALTEPMPGDTRSRNRFELLDPGHQQQVERAYRASGETMVYLGTWHSHPEREPHPSGVDKADWRQCMRRNKNRSLVFAIVGTSLTRMYVPWGRWFRTLTQDPTCQIKP